MKKTKTYSALEKTVFFTGLVILFGLFSYLIFQSITSKYEPAKLEINISREVGTEYSTFKTVVQNKGGTTAAAVNISFDLYKNGTIIETAMVRMDYVPIQSQKTARVVFYQQSTSDSLVVSSITYEEP